MSGFVLSAQVAKKLFADLSRLVTLKKSVLQRCQLVAELHCLLCCSCSTHAFWQCTHPAAGQFCEPLVQHCALFLAGREVAFLLRATQTDASCATISVEA